MTFSTVFDISHGLFERLLICTKASAENLLFNYLHLNSGGTTLIIESIKDTNTALELAYSV